MRSVLLCAAIAASLLTTPSPLCSAELWLTCGPMAVGGRCKTEGALGFYNDAREKQLSAQVTCTDHAYKPVVRHECYPLSNPASPGEPELRVVCTGASQNLVLSAAEYNDAYLRCRRLCDRCAYGDWQ